MKPVRGPIEVTSAKDQQQGLKDIVKYLKKHKVEFGTMAEVGVWLGASVTVWQKHFKEVYAIDHWKGDEHTPDVYEKFINAFKDCDNVKPIRDVSLNAVKRFEDESLDFVYIDGDHRPEFVKQDIELWLPKIKKGGAIAGHDYGRGIEEGFDFTGLTKAVDELLGKPDKVFKDTSWLKQR